MSLSFIGYGLTRAEWRALNVRAWSEASWDQRQTHKGRALAFERARERLLAEHGLERWGEGMRKSPSVSAASR
jgi:hypothetical protein